MNDNNYYCLGKRKIRLSASSIALKSVSAISPINFLMRNLSTARMCSMRALESAPIDGVASSNGGTAGLFDVVSGSTMTVCR